MPIESSHPTDSLPLIAMAIGDPAGISPELGARLVVDEEVARHCVLLVIGDSRVLSMGARDAGLALELPVVQTGGLAGLRSHAMLERGDLDPATIERGVVSLAGGRSALGNFVAALELARDARVEAVTFTPFNKQAMRLARPGYDDEIAVVSEVLDSRRPGREFNVLGRLWNARVTSHIPLKDVTRHLSIDAIFEGARLADECMRAAGFEAPRLAIAAVNPHAGDGGSFGREEIDVQAPAIERMKAAGLRVTGPVPADTVFVRATKGEFDAVLTMYHDQGQIAMKLMGFDQGVTLLGGYPFPICTPAHGTAYDIAGKGVADIKAGRNAILLAASMALRNRHAARAAA